MKATGDISVPCVGGPRLLPSPSATAQTAALFCCLLLWPCLSAIAHDPYLVPAPPARAFDWAQSRSVLFLNGGGGTPSVLVMQASFRQQLLGAAPFRVDLLIENIDPSRGSDPKFHPKLIDWYRQLYAGRRIDAIFVNSSAALEIALALRARPFAASTPVIFVGTDRPAANPPHVTGLAPESVDQISVSLHAALALVPGARQLILIRSRESNADGRYERFTKALAASGRNVQLLDWVDVPIDQVHQRAASLPQDSIVCCLEPYDDGLGNALVPFHAISMLASTSNRPVFPLDGSRLLIGRGIVGGCLYDPTAIGIEAANRVVEVLVNGPDTPPSTQRTSVFRLAFDDQQLHRFGLERERLPEASDRLFHEPGPWELYHWYIIGGLIIIIAQSASIVALVASRWRERAAQAAVRYRDEQMQLAVDACGVAIWSYDPQSRAVSCSPTAARLLGLPDGQPVSLEQIMRQLHPDDVPVLAAAVESSMKDNIPFDFQYRLLLPGGQVRWISTRGKRVSTPNGIQLKGASIDITLRKQAELDAHQYRQELLHVTRIATLGELSSSFAHELNQPLGAIQCNADALRLMLDADRFPGAETRAVLDAIQSDALRAAETLQRLRNLMRKSEIRKQELDINQVIRTVASLLLTEFRHRGIALAMQLQDDLPPVLGDPAQLQHALINLLINGMDAMSRTPADRRRLLVRSESAGDAGVRVAVVDAGHGISPDDLPRLFEPFFTTKPTGLGIGLTIVKAIVESHDGSMAVESDPGSGASFSFVLPSVIEKRSIPHDACDSNRR